MDWRVLGNSLTLYKQAPRWPPTDVILLVSMVIINLKVHETPQAGLHVHLVRWIASLIAGMLQERH